MKNSIVLILKGNVWCAKHSDSRIKELFGTEILPTPFSSDAFPDTVQKKIARLNPDCEVTLDPESLEAYYDADPIRNEWNGIPHPSEMITDKGFD